MIVSSCLVVRRLRRKTRSDRRLGYAVGIAGQAIFPLWPEARGLRAVSPAEVRAFAAGRNSPFFWKYRVNLSRFPTSIVTERDPRRIQRVE